MILTINKQINRLFNGKLKEISRFSVIGVMNTLIDFTVFTVFKELLGAGCIVSQITGYSCGVANSFIFNKSWTFSSRRNNRTPSLEFTRFILVNLISLLITTLLINLLINSLNMNVYLSKVIVTFISQAINFFGYKFIVFNFRDKN